RIFFGVPRHVGARAPKPEDQETKTNRDVCSEKCLHAGFPFASRARGTNCRIRIKVQSIVSELFDRSSKNQPKRINRLSLEPAKLSGIIQPLAAQPRYRMIVMKLLFLIGVAALAFVFQMGQSHAADRPNVVLIVTDDQGYGDLGIHGNPKIRTPVLDALAKQS